MCIPSRCYCLDIEGQDILLHFFEASKPVMAYGRSNKGHLMHRAFHIIAPIADIELSGPLVLKTQSPSHFHHMRHLAGAASGVRSPIAVYYLQKRLLSARVVYMLLFMTTHDLFMLSVLQISTNTCILLVLLRKGFRDTNNLIIDIFFKQKRNLKNTVVS